MTRKSSPPSRLGRHLFCSPISVNGDPEPASAAQKSHNSSLCSEVAAGYVNSGSARPPRVSQLPRLVRLKRVSPIRLRGRPTGGTEDLLAPGPAGTILGSVDGWLIATVLQGLWGECFRRYPPPGADSAIATLHLRGACCLAWWSQDPIARPRTAAWGTQWGQLDGCSVSPCVRAGRPLQLGAPPCAPLPCNAPLPKGGLPGASSPEARLGSG